MKQGFLSAMATIGYGLVVIVVVLATALGIMIGIKGIGQKDEEIFGLDSSTPTTQGLKSEQDIFESTDSSGNKVFNVSTTLDFSQKDYTDEEKQQFVSVAKTIVEEKIVDAETGEKTYSKIIKMSIKGKVDGQNDAQYSSQKTEVRLTKSTNYNELVGKDETPVLFLTYDAEGNEVLTTTITVQINEEFSLKILTYKATNPYLNTNTTTTAEDDQKTEESAEKDYIKGGSVYIMSRSVGTSLKSAPAKIQVDVPIESMVITATTKNKNGEDVDVTNIVNNTATFFGNENVQSTAESDTTKWDIEKTIKYIGESTNTLEKNEYYYYNSTTLAWESLWTRGDVMAFIKNSEITLGIKTFPENAIKAVESMNKGGLVVYSANDLTPAVYKDDKIDKLNQYDPKMLKLGVLKIYEDQNSAPFRISAKIPKLFKNGKDYNANSDYLEATDIIFRVEPVKIESIEITGEDLKDGVLYVDAYDSVSFSATYVDTNTLNLGIKIKSKHYVWGEDPSQQNISNLIANEVIERNFNVSQLNSSFLKVFNIKIEENSNTKIWTIENLRNYLNTGDGETGLSEKIKLYLSCGEYKEGETFKDPYAELEIKINQTLPSSEFAYNGKNTNGVVEINMTKQDAFFEEVVKGNVSEDVIDTAGILKVDTTTASKNFVSFAGSINPTYTKWVYFAVPTEGKNLDDTNTNDVGSKIVNLTSFGQIVFDGNTGKSYSSQIYALGDGEIQIVALLVLTDKDGVPVDCYYNKITEFDTGYVMLDSITKTDFENNTYKGQFAVVFCPTTTKNNEQVINSCTIKVVEELSDYAVFYDDRKTTEDTLKFNDKVEGVVYLPMTSGSSNKTLFVVANSSKALENICNVGFESLSNTGERLQYYYGVSSKNEDKNKCIKDEFSAESGTTYQIRYIPLNITYMGNNADEPEPTVINVIQKSGDENVACFDFTLNVKNVKVDKIDVDYKVDEQNNLVTNTSMTYNEKTYDFDTLTLKTDLSANKPEWKFVYGENLEAKLQFNPQVDYTYNLEPAHDYKNLSSTKPVTNHFNVLVLSDTGLCVFSDNSTNYDHFNKTYNSDCKIQIEPVYDVGGSVVNLQFVLKSGWEDYITSTQAKNNVILFYSVRTSDSSIVASKIFLLDMSDCTSGAIKDLTPSSTRTYGGANETFSGWSYAASNDSPLAINANEVGLDVVYGETQKSLSDVVKVTLNDGFNLNLTLNNGYSNSAGTGGTAVLKANDNFTVTFVLFSADNVAYQFNYTFKLGSAIYKTATS